MVDGLQGRQIQFTLNLFTSWPSLSPDGTEVVFASDTPAEKANILKLNITTRRIEKLTNNAEQDIRYRELDWSSDGRKILFIMTTWTPKGQKNYLCVMDVKGHNVRHILQPELPTTIYGPSWSPDSRYILYYQDGRGNSGLFITDDNGNHTVNVTQDPTKKEGAPAWSPNRHQIAYRRIIETKPPPPNPLQIYTMSVDEASVTTLTSGSDASRIPLAWHPDGRQTLFATLSFLNTPFDTESDI